MSSTDEATIEDAPEGAPAEEAAPEPVDELRAGVLARITDALGDGVVDHHIRAGDDLWVRVTREAWSEAGRFARDRLGARYFCFLSAIDWMPSPFGRSMDSEIDKILAGEEAKEAAPIVQGYAGGETRFQVFARVANQKDHYGVTFKVDLPDDDLRVDTWIPNYAGANWHERECFEMFGIAFEGHPFLRKLYLPGGFEGNPLRKDFPLLARLVKAWPGIVDVEEMPALPEEEGADGEAAEGGAEGTEGVTPAAPVEELPPVEEGDA